MRLQKPKRSLYATHSQVTSTQIEPPRIVRIVHMYRSGEMKDHRRRDI